MKMCFKKWKYSAYAAILLIMAAVFLSLCGCIFGSREARANYEKGTEYYNDGLYKEAKECFLAAENYSNTKEFLSAIAEYENLYLEGVEKVKNHDYQDAYAIFKIIPKYENAGEYMVYMDQLSEKYEEGKRLYFEKKYFSARSCFIESNSYSNSDEYVENIDAMAKLYNLGMELMNSGRYSEAIKAFEGIGTEFEDSAEWIKICREKLPLQTVSIKEYICNFNDQYSDGAVKINSGSMDKEFQLSDSRGVLISGSAETNGNIRLIMFNFSTELLDLLGEEGFKTAAAGFIHALNPEFMQLDLLFSDIDRYLTEHGADYGCMHIKLRSFEQMTILEADRVY